MRTFTAMSGAGIQAVIDARANTGEHYDMRLNGPDFASLMWALSVVAESREASYLVMDSEVNLDEWAADFASSIAETLGIEFV